MKQSKLEAWFKLLLDSNGIKGYVQEHKFAPNRKFRADFCWVKKKIICEVEGGIWCKGGGRHNRGIGYSQDTEKYNLATILGYRVLRYTQQTMHNAIDDLQELL